MGNIDSLRDWGHAKDYVYMQWLMLQQDSPDDYVIATGRQESVRTFIELTAKKIGWAKNKDEPAIIWEGEGINEIGRRADTMEIVVKIDPIYFRPSEVETLLGDASKSQEKLGWKSKTTLEELISEMVENDLKEAEKESYLKNKGFDIVSSLENPPNN